MKKATADRVAKYFKHLNKMTPTQLKKIIDQDFGIDISDKTRTSNYVLARDVFFAVAHRLFYPRLSYTKIGALVGRNHATVMHSLSKHKYEDFWKTMERYRKIYDPDWTPTPIDDKYNELVLKYNALLLERQESGIDEKLSFFPEDTRKELIERFEFIIDMEKRKRY